ncbi:MAG TPA: VOC family protein [Candidatus Nanoarchaeia archaeon]|nr:VOC family protein [Candidatus Nanoarchaeia archaeon]
MNPVVHFEFPADDRKRMIDFYEKAFGWRTKQLGEDMGNYVLVETTETENRMVKKPGAINGGLYDRKMGGNASKCPSVVISVDDINKHLDIVKEAGGKIIDKPMEIPGVGWLVSFIDTEGNVLSMMQPVAM